MSRDKLVKEFMKDYEMGLKDDERFIYLFATIRVGIDYKRINYKTGYDIINEYVKTGKLKIKSETILHLLEEGGDVTDSRIDEALSKIKKSSTKQPKKTAVKDMIIPKGLSALERKSFIENYDINKRQDEITKKLKEEAPAKIAKIMIDVDKALASGEINQKEYERIKAGLEGTYGTENELIKLRKERERTSNLNTDRGIEIKKRLNAFNDKYPYGGYKQGDYFDVTNALNAFKYDEAEKALDKLIDSMKDFSYKKPTVQPPKKPEPESESESEPEPPKKPKPKSEPVKKVKKAKSIPKPPPPPPPKKSKYTGPEYREETIKKKGYSSILQGKSDIVYDKDEEKDKIESLIKIPKGLAPKLKKTLKKSVIEEMKKKIKIEGSGIHLDYSD